MIAFNDKFELRSDVQCSDKSLTHRAFIAAAIADSKSVIRNVTFSRDVLSTVEALRALGANIAIKGDCAVVTPVVSPPEGQVVLNCGNSGTTARLLAGVAAGLGVNAVFTGDESLSKRPMDRVVKPLRRLGADIFLRNDCLFECRGGALRGAEIISEVNSAQVKSAVLFAGLFAEGETVYSERCPTRDHTEILLRELGADIAVGQSVSVRKSRIRGFETVLPNDPSSAAYSVALALLTKREALFTDVLLNERRMGFYRALQRAGARIQFVNVRSVLGEKVGDVEVLPSELSPLTLSAAQAADAIDEIPLLAVISLFTAGTHTFEGVSELAFKESDRIEAILHMASVAKQRAEFCNGTLTVHSDGKPLAKRRFKTFGDHRVAMCEAVACIAAGGGCIDDAPFDVSHPNFLSSIGVCPLKLGLIGTHVAQSVSPRMQTYLAMQAGVCCSYVTVTLPENVSDGELLRVAQSFDGLNVTMPFKTRMAKLLKADVPAVNTIGKNIAATSTDGYGLTRPLEKHGVCFAKKPLWIVGAGGAAESCVCELLKYGCQLQVINRTEANAKRLRDKYSLPESVADPEGVLTFLPECAFEKQIVLPESCKFVFIAAYMGKSGVRLQAEERGLVVADGFEMNYFQGALGFSLWTGTAVQDDYEGYLKYVKEFDYV